jgi:glycosyltransferase involved in cell wall biosynthesis
MSTAAVHKKAIAVIPCLNEEKFIGEVAARAVKYVDEVIVIDDASSDNTSAVAAAAGATVIRHDKSQGAGAGTRTGFEAALAHGADIIVALDGDGQHDADEIPILIQPIAEGQADIVIGSRFLKEAKVARYRKFGIDVITWAYNFGHKEKIIDAQSGFRAHSRRAVEAMKITYPGFGFSIQTLVQARKQGLKIIERPISCIYHGEGSTLNPLVHGFHVVWAILKIRVREQLFNRGTA